MFADGRWAAAARRPWRRSAAGPAPSAGEKSAAAGAPAAPHTPPQPHLPTPCPLARAPLPPTHPPPPTHPTPPLPRSMSPRALDPESCVGQDVVAEDDDLQLLTALRRQVQLRAAARFGAAADIAASNSGVSAADRAYQAALLARGARPLAGCWAAARLLPGWWLAGGGLLGCCRAAGCTASRALQPPGAAACACRAAPPRAGAAAAAHPPFPLPPCPAQTAARAPSRTP
jgi:hypothetical protein